MREGRVLGLALTALLVGAVTLTAAPAQARTSSAPRAHTAPQPQHARATAPGQPCVRRLAARRDGRIERDPRLSPGQVRAQERDLARRLGLRRNAGPRALRREGQQRSAAKRRITVKVSAHVVKPSKRAHVLNGSKVRRQIRIMNRAYRGRQSRPAYNTHVRFRLTGVDHTVNRSWFRAGPHSQASKQMRRELRHGGRGTLNLYFAAPRGGGGTLLGYSTFAHNAHKYPRLDAVVVNYKTAKRHQLEPYSKGDTAVHEAGHWLGLYHTFQGGCGKRNDRVTDTAREQSPAYRCPRHRNTCAAPGRDPVHNFMDYSDDSCMNRFTRGQSARMKLSWLAYRD